MLLTASSSNALGNGISDISGVIEAIAAVFNLLLVVYFFFKDKKEFRKRENVRIKEQTYGSWYNLLVRERLLESLDDYFNKIEKIITE